MAIYVILGTNWKNIYTNIEKIIIIEKYTGCRVNILIYKPSKFHNS